MTSTLTPVVAELAHAGSAAATPRWRRSRTTRTWGMVACALALVAASVASLVFGVRDVPIDQVWHALTTPGVPGIDAAAALSRVPTTVAGILIGAALGVGGALMQGVTRNPLADPGLLGINSGAALFVVIAMTFLGVSSAIGTVWFAFAGAAVAAIVVYAVASAGRRGATPFTLTLAGAAVTAAAASITTGVLLTNVASLDSYRFWQIGSISAPAWSTILLLAPFIVVGLVLALFQGSALNALALGDDLARGLGHRVGLSRVLTAVAVVLLCGAATAMAGPIAFVGLAVPHAARLVFGADYRWILPAAAFLGGVLLLVADVIGRLVARPSTIEVGVVVAIIGAPVLIALVRRTKAVAL
ncbi:iron ABC transporter permease [Planctomonas sp. JC2975]|uniref:FecCD family ABC transporter permease n=1 Tax=Planctomonas sp. JC2975 TaxID=2729626 RepID=UPI0014759E6A|nr:iron ABC transporter permease [Planctomonas sp. JC2975]NNC13099.1 iron ABC transporter permease [Planctomonas sp. JC2975]